MEPPDAAQDLSAVLLQYESNLLEVPLSPVIMSHTIVRGCQPWSSACPEAPMTSHKHNQTFTHSKCPGQTQA